jgi:type IV secretory pathway VirB10-like protein
VPRSITLAHGRLDGEDSPLRDRLKVMLKRAGSHPRELMAYVLAAGAAGAILVNALFLQSVRHPAPWFASTTVLPVARSVPVSQSMPAAQPMPRPRPPEAGVAAEPAKPPAKAVAAAKSAPPVKQAAATPQPAPSRDNATTRTDPLADLIASSRRIALAQRALSDFGYGQIKPTGVADPDTQAAIEKFERERMLPVTGKFSDRMLRDLGTVTGRSFD